MARPSPRALLPLLAGTRALPPRIAAFQARALLLAWRLGDEFALRSATRPHDVAELLRLARGRLRVAELGTATGWTAGALLLADRERQVTSFDPVVQAHRERYLALLPGPARERLTLVQATGVEGAATVAAEAIDFLFVDSTHDRAGTVAEWRAWQPRLAPDALVALHDFGNPSYPGVAEAVTELGLSGVARGGCFVCPAR